MSESFNLPKEKVVTVLAMLVKGSEMKSVSFYDDENGTRVEYTLDTLVGDLILTIDDKGMWKIIGLLREDLDT